jgi:hypothetical protein
MNPLSPTLFMPGSSTVELPIFPIFLHSTTYAGAEFRCCRPIYVPIMQAFAVLFRRLSHLQSFYYCFKLFVVVWSAPFWNKNAKFFRSENH